MDLISIREIFSIVEVGISGGVSMISTRHAPANNHYMAEFDAARINSYIIYLDVNKLFAWAMT